MSLSTTTKWHQTRRWICLFSQLTLLLWAFDSCSNSVTAFSPVTHNGKYRANSLVHRSTAMAGSFFVDGTQKQEPTTEIAPVLDAKGQVITVGAIVRIAVEGLEAYQISPKAKGAFNEQKEFVPDTSESLPIGRRCLLLPVGLRGVVSKLYNVDEVSANFPIQVKFTPGSHTGEGYDAPAAFLMHFDTHEVEVVSD